MKKLFSVLLGLSLCLPCTPGHLFSASNASIIGTVTYAFGDAVPGVRIIARDRTGRLLGEARTNSGGQYSLPNLPPGQLQLTLETDSTGLRGNTAVTNLGEQGLTVNWTVSRTSDAIAFASVGTSGDFGAPASAVVAGAVLLGWSGSLIWATTRRFDGDKPGSGSN